MADLADYEWLTSPTAAQWLDEVRQSGLPTHRQLTLLRKTLPSERARLVLQQVELRQRARAKYDNFADSMFFTDQSLQQATDLWLARYKASRLPLEKPVVDYCCGIGGDLLAFAERCASTGWDRAPELVHLATANLRVLNKESTSRVCLGDVAEQTPAANAVWHLDPDRRSDGRRTTQLQWQSPGPEVVDRWLRGNPNGCLKLAPATEVPTSWSEQAELEWITRDRQCRQQVVWFGELATAHGQRRATAIIKTADESATVETASFIGAVEVDPPISEAVSNYVYDTDPSIRAAQLTGALANELQLAALQRDASYLTSDSPVEHPLITRFAVLDQFPLRVKTVAKYLSERNIGELEIKKRGVTLEPERLRKQLKLSGTDRATLLLTRVGASEIAIFSRRDEG